MNAIRDRIKEFRRVPAGELLANPKNWRTHPTAQREALCGVLEEIGFAGALLAYEGDNGQLVLIDGHLRAEISPEMQIPVLVADVDEAEAAKLLATIDPLAAMAGTNNERLDSLLREVQTGNEALASMLTSMAEKNGLYQAEETAAAAELVDDEIPEPPADLVTQPGDLWILGQHRLVCGDSTDAATVARALDGATPFLMVTDPPYGVEYDADWRDEFNSGKAATSENVANDHRFDWTESYKLFPGHVAYVWHAARFAAEFASNLKDAGFDIRSQIIWAKPSLVMSRGHYHWQHEPCWYAVRKGGSAKWEGGRKQSTLWQIGGMSAASRTEERVAHPTQKPIDCMGRPIRNHGKKNDDVYEPFAGSGSTLIAAEQLGRRCFAIELQPGFCDVIVARWEKLTGQKAERAHETRKKAAADRTQDRPRKSGKAATQRGRAKAAG